MSYDNEKCTSEMQVLFSVPVGGTPTIVAAPVLAVRTKRTSCGAT